jgi:hypothetical protein
VEEAAVLVIVALECDLLAVRGDLGPGRIEKDVGDSNRRSSLAWNPVQETVEDP